MALINCPECGTEVSDKANACPKCAFPIKIAETITQPSNVEGEKSSPPRINRTWGHISWITYLSIGLLFLLPFCDLNCSGRKVGSLSGIVLVTGASLSPTLLGTEIGESRDIPANLWAILAFLSTLLGFLVSISYFRSNILSGILGLACAFFLIILQVSINAKMNEQEYSLFTVSFTIAYWISLISAVAIGIINFSTTQSHFSQNELITLSFKSVAIIIIYYFVISNFDSTSPFLFRPTLNSLNSELSSYSFGSSPKEMEEKRIADSILVADSLAMMQAEQQRVNDSILSMEFLSCKVLDSIFHYNFSKTYTRCKIFTPSGNKDPDGSTQGSWSEVKKTVTLIDFQINSKNSIVLHNLDGSISTYNNVGERTFQKLSDGIKFCNLIGTSNKGNKKTIQYLENGSIAIFDNLNSSGVLFIP